MIIAIEGIDGAGKTTLAKKLKEWLENLGKEVIIIKEPGESEWGKKVKRGAKSVDEELYLFIKDREINVKEKIIPSLKKGKIVIMDRYYYSNMAYQGAKGIDIDVIRNMNETIAPKPDIVILLDCDPEICIDRVKKRGKTSRFEEVNYLRKVRDKFLEIAKKDKKVKIVNAEKSIDEVFKEAKKIVKDFLSKQDNLSS